MKLYDMGMEPGRKPFLDCLFAYLDEKGTPMSYMPTILKQPIDLFHLYMIVQEMGGMLEVGIAIDEDISHKIQVGYDIKSDKNKCKELS
jgi:hypothetical protein